VADNQSNVEDLRAELTRLREASVAERERLTTRLMEAEQRSLDDRLGLLSELLDTINKRDDSLEDLVATVGELEASVATARAEATNLRSMLREVMKVHTQLVNTPGKSAPLRKYRHYQQLLHRLNEVKRVFDGD